MLKRIAFGLVAFLLLAIAVLGVTVSLRWRRTFNPVAVSLHSSKDTAIIARGRDLVRNQAACSDCHGDPTRQENGDAVLSGGRLLPIPPVTLHIPNLTSDPTFGIGARSDAELVRLIRHGMRRDARAAFPMMEYHNLSDDDVVAIISYLRTLSPVPNPVPEHEYTLLGKALMALMITPVGPDSTPPLHSPMGLTVSRGEYLARSVSMCVACHTPRDMHTGAFTGPAFSGGFVMEEDSGSYSTPNLTPDPATGHINGWSEDAFVRRIHMGRLVPGSPMPWQTFSRMNDNDLRAIYRYLRSLPPAHHDTGPVFTRRVAS